MINNMLKNFPASLRAGLHALPSFALMNPSVAFAPEYPTYLAMLVAVVVLVVSTCCLLKIAVDQLRAPASDDGLSLTAVSVPPGLVAHLSSDTLTYIVAVS